MPGEGQVRGALLWSLLSSARLACDIIQKFRNVPFAQSSKNTCTPTDRPACSIYRRNAECGVALVQPSWPEQDPSPWQGCCSQLHPWRSSTIQTWCRGVLRPQRSRGCCQGAGGLKLHVPASNTARERSVAQGLCLPCVPWR